MHSASGVQNPSSMSMSSVSPVFFRGVAGWRRRTSPTLSSALLGRSSQRVLRVTRTYHSSRVFSGLQTLLWKDRSTVSCIHSINIDMLFFSSLYSLAAASYRAQAKLKLDFPVVVISSCRDTQRPHKGIPLSSFIQGHTILPSSVFL